MFLIGSPEQEDDTLSLEAASAPQAVLLVTPTLPGLVYTLLVAYGRLCFFELLRYSSTLFNIQAVTSSIHIVPMAL
jgi:hypothetical protein